MVSLLLAGFRPLSSNLFRYCRDILLVKVETAPFTQPSYDEIGLDFN